MSLCSPQEAKAFHPPEPTKCAKGAALWAISIILALAGAGAYVFGGIPPWY